MLYCVSKKSIFAVAEITDEKTAVISFQLTECDFMKHVFIINPAAGHSSSADRLTQELEQYSRDYDCSVYQTKAPGDATQYVRGYCQTHADEEIRFYACGGDGTLSEVVNGMADFPNASITVYPCGSGNDYVKYYGGAAAFLDIPALLNAQETPVDLMRIGDRLCINVSNFGFDTAVVQTMEKVKRIRGLGGKKAYYCGVIAALTRHMRTRCIVSADGEKLNSRDLLLCTVANGNYVGSSFRCAPHSDNADGLLEVCLVNPVSRFTFVRLIGSYTKGTHLDDPKVAKYMVYRRARTIDLTFPDGGYLCIDGELIHDTHFSIEVLPRSIRFAVPAGAKIPAAQG